MFTWEPTEDWPYCGQVEEQRHHGEGRFGQPDAEETAVAFPECLATSMVLNSSSGSSEKIYGWE